MCSGIDCEEDEVDPLYQAMDASVRKVKRPRFNPKRFSEDVTYVVWNRSPSACALKLEIEVFDIPFKERANLPKRMRHCMGIYPSYHEARVAVQKRIRYEMAYLGKYLWLLEQEPPIEFMELRKMAKKYTIDGKRRRGYRRKTRKVINDWKDGGSNPAKPNSVLDGKKSGV